MEGERRSAVGGQRSAGNDGERRERVPTFVGIPPEGGRRVG